MPLKKSCVNNKTKLKSGQTALKDRNHF